MVAIATGTTRSSRRCVRNIQEVKARDGMVLAVTDHDPDDLDGLADEVDRACRARPDSSSRSSTSCRCSCSPTTIGVRRGADVDQPRNLAKSVTVE